MRTLRPEAAPVSHVQEPYDPVGCRQGWGRQTARIKQSNEIQPMLRPGRAEQSRHAFFLATALCHTFRQYVSAKLAATTQVVHTRTVDNDLPGTPWYACHFIRNRTSMKATDASGPQWFMPMQSQPQSDADTSPHFLHLPLHDCGALCQNSRSCVLTLRSRSAAPTCWLPPLPPGKRPMPTQPIKPAGACLPPPHPRCHASGLMRHPHPCCC
jgi:hypothetical protein